MELRSTHHEMVLSKHCLRGTTYRTLELMLGQTLIKGNRNKSSNLLQKVPQNMYREVPSSGTG